MICARSDGSRCGRQTPAWGHGGRALAELAVAPVSVTVVHRNPIRLALGALAERGADVIHEMEPCRDGLTTPRACARRTARSREVHRAGVDALLGRSAQVERHAQRAVTLAHGEIPAVPARSLLAIHQHATRQGGRETRELTAVGLADRPQHGLPIRVGPTQPVEAPGGYRLAAAGLEQLRRFETNLLQMLLPLYLKGQTHVGSASPGGYRPPHLPAGRAGHIMAVLQVRGAVLQVRGGTAACGAGAA